MSHEGHICILKRNMYITHLKRNMRKYFQDKYNSVAALILYYLASTVKYRTIAHLLGVSTSFAYVLQSFMKL